MFNGVRRYFSRLAFKYKMSKKSSWWMTTYYADMLMKYKNLGYEITFGEINVHDNDRAKTDKPTGPTICIGHGGGIITFSNNGVWHRYDGPAVIFTGRFTSAGEFSNRWFVDGKMIVDIAEIMSNNDIDINNITDDDVTLLKMAIS